MREQGVHFLPGKDDRRAGGTARPLDAFDVRQVCAQHVAVEEQKRAEGLILRGGGDIGLDRQMREELAHLIDSHLRGLTVTVEEDETPDPVTIVTFGAEAEVTHARDGAHLI